MFLVPATAQEICQIVNSLNSTSSVGYDEVPINIIKESIPLIAEPLSEVVNACFQQGVYPSSLKHSMITPIFKKGDPTQTNNYRPISVLSCFSKILEKLISVRITEFLMVHKILNINQHGFLKGRGTDTALLEFTDFILKALEKGRVAASVMLDLEKAFDCVNVELLMRKIERYGLRGLVRNLLESYLVGRTHCCKIRSMNGRTFFSDVLTVGVGVPQGSILGPLLFIIYVNDIFLLPITAKVICYADDTTIVDQYRDTEELLESTERHLSVAAAWFSSNCLSLNSNKTKFTLFANTLDKPEELTYNGLQITRSNYSCLLGLTVDDNLTYRLHIDQVCTKIYKNIFGLRILVKNTNKHISKTFYYSNIHSHFRYAIIFWGSVSYSERAFIAQKRALRALRGLRFTDSCRGLFREEGVLTVPAVYIYESISFLVKHPEYFDEYRSDTSNRHGQDFRLPRHRLTKYEKGAVYSCIKLWNKIPNTIKHIKQPRLLRRALFHYLCTMEPYSVKDFYDS